MNIQGIYAALTTRDIKAAEDFYAALFGRGPDDRPMAGLIQWRDVEGANVQLFKDDETAGKGRLTIVVPVMAEARKSLEAAHIALGEEFSGDFGKIAQLRDPDGNLLTLAEPPSRGLVFVRSRHNCRQGR